MPHPAPLWVDAAPALALPAAHPVHYFPLAHPSPQLPPKLPPASQDAPLPRPRKPYTATKVREMWSSSEHQRMLEGLRLFKRDWSKVTEHVGTRSTAQVRSHAQKYFDKVAREKTDDYVPRARPKRKSATPYPRKLRDQPSVTAHVPPAPAQHPNNPNSNAAAAAAAPAAPAPAPAHPHAFAFPMHHLHPAVAAAHAAQPPSAMHHPAMHMQYATPPSPFMPQMHHPSPYAAQPQPHIAIQQQPAAPTIFSPYLNMCHSQSPNLRSPTFDSSMHPSPVSFISGHTYAAQSPSLHPQHMSMAHPVYNVFSPLTPAAYAPAVRRSSPVAHQSPTPIVPMAQLQQPVAAHSHVHSHPNGPLPNCAKCNALRRYGAVLHEIVQIGATHPMPTTPLLQPNQPPQSQPAQHPQHNQPPARPSAEAAEPATQPTDSTACPTAPEQSVSTSGKKSVDDSPPSCNDGAIRARPSQCPAKSRAQRLKLLKSKKMASKLAAMRKAKSNVSSGEISESDNFSRRNTLSTDMSRPRSREDSTVEANKQICSSAPRPKKRRSSQITSSAVATKHQTDSLQRRPKKLKCVPIAPSPAPAVKVAKRSRAQTVSKPDDRIAPPTKTAPEANNACKPAPKRKDEKLLSSDSLSPNSPKPESESEVGSPRVETYSRKEQKEIFDAVHSLQILSRTPSSSSPSLSDSKGDSDSGN